MAFRNRQEQEQVSIPVLIIFLLNMVVIMILVASYIDRHKDRGLYCADGELHVELPKDVKASTELVCKRVENTLRCHAL